jgi:CNT family concentrative nucleoside transporter
VIGLIPLAGAPLTLERLLGWGFAPLVWSIGVPWDQAPAAGQLMGVKTVLNELIAYRQLAGEPGAALDARSATVMAYALCGFANPGSLGIMIAGLSGIAPDRRDEILALAPRAFVAGTLATLMTGAVVGLLV